jgi:Shikimate dehydrogenase substrate binding domain
VKSAAHGKPKACVIGWPVAHSRSPLIHRFWLERLKIEGSYELAAVAPADFPAFVHDLARNGFAGANVTLPHKRKAFELCDNDVGGGGELASLERRTNVHRGRELVWHGRDESSSHFSSASLQACVP